MEKIRHLADISIRRGCGFGLIAIWTATMGMAYDASLAVRAGALLLTLMGTILVIKSIRAPVRNFRHTELWILLDRQHGLPENQAQQMIGGVLRDRYMWHAQITAVAALVLWLLAFLLAAIRLPGAE